MSAATVRGWCPSLHDPMAALDGLIVRVKPYVRGLSAADLECIAEAAEAAGAGGLELTGRGAIQVRGLGEAGAAMFATAMVEAGLASADAAVERRRNMQLGVGCGTKLLGLAGGLERWLEDDASLSALPSKFGFAVSPDGRIVADIAVVGDDESHIVIGGDVVIGVGVGPQSSALPGLVPGIHDRTSPPPNGHPTARHGPPEHVQGRREGGGAAALDAVQRLTRAFLTLAPGLPVPPRRMKALVQDVGLAAVLAEAGLMPAEPAPRLNTLETIGELQRDYIETVPLWLRPADAAVPISRQTVGPSQNGYGLGVVLGLLTPSALRAAAALATRYGDGRVLLARGRVIWLSGVASSAQVRLADEAPAAGFVVDTSDRRLRLDACVGRAGCARAREDVRADALRLAWAVPATGLHVSGCVKGCARPGVAGVTLVSRGDGGRYDLILDGAPSAPPTRTDVRLDDIAEHLSEPAL